MAVIGTIRKQSAFLVIIIGVALAAFVLGDFARGGRSGSREVNIGVVGGEEITIMDFNKKVDQNIEATKQQQQKERLTPEEAFRLRNETWKQMVNQILLDSEYEELGLSVTSEELFDMIQGPNPHPLIVQSFTNPQTGVFDRNLVIQFLQTLDQNRPEVKQQWYTFEEYLIHDRLRTKYNNLISKGYYVPNEIAKVAFHQENDKASVKYVAKKYVEVNDSLINPTDDDYEKAYEANKEKYKQVAYRDFDYVVFEVKPSVKDLQNARKQMNELFEEFQNTDDIARFVLMNSDNRYDSTWKTEGQLPVQVDSIMFNSEEGTVVKPYMERNMFHLARLAEIGYRPDSMKASHILVAYQGALRANPEISRTKDQAENLADSLYQVLKSSSNKIGSLAKDFSDDPSAASNGGDLGWFADGMMVTSFNETVLNTKVGRVAMVESPFGFHIIKVTGKKDPVKKVRVAFVDREVVVSSETYQQIFAKASKLAAETNNIEEFSAAVEDERLNRRKAQKVHAMDNNIAGLNSPRQIILWAFNEDREVGDISEVFDLEGQFVVAGLVTKAEEGYPPLVDVKTRLNSTVFNDLKGKIILDELAATGNDFQSLSQNENFKSYEMAALTFASRNLQGFGTEDDVIGSVFGSNDGDTFGPVEGKGGIFVVQVDRITRSTGQDNYLETAKKLQNTIQTRINQGVIYTALEEASDIEDNRLLFY